MANDIYAVGEVYHIDLQPDWDARRAVERHELERRHQRDPGTNQDGLTGVATLSNGTAVAVGDERGTGGGIIE